MAKRSARRRAPVILIVDDHEWSARSLETFLTPSGFAVMRAYTRSSGLERATVHLPDLIIINADLPDGDSLELCRALRDDPQLGQRTPIIMTSAERPARQLRLSAYRAGAWDLLSYPIDPEELILKLESYVRAKLEGDRLQDEGLIDVLTGLYSLPGLERRANELSAWAYREHAPLACVVFTPETEGTPQQTKRFERAIVQALAKGFKSAGRISDVIGRLGESEFVVLAPGTDAEGAVHLAERLVAAIHVAGDEAALLENVKLRAGYEAIPDVHAAPAEARDLMVHAAVALRRAQRAENGWISRYDATLNAS